MADLDDFFAKKDRKKTKGKKFATPDEFVKKLEDSTRKTSESKPRKELQSTQSDGVENESGEQLPAPEVCVFLIFFFYANLFSNFFVCACFFMHILRVWLHVHGHTCVDTI